MADKKTTVKKTSKTVTNSISDLRSLSAVELQKKLLTARQDLLEAQKSLKANELANPHVVTKMRKEIARIMTVISELNAAVIPDASCHPELVSGSRKKEETAWMLKQVQHDKSGAKKSNSNGKETK